MSKTKQINCKSNLPVRTETDTIHIRNVFDIQCKENKRELL